MKTSSLLLCGLFSLILTALLEAVPYDVRGTSQRNAANTAFINFDMLPPAAGSIGIYITEPINRKPEIYTGVGFTIDNTARTLTVDLSAVNTALAGKQAHSTALDELAALSISANEAIRTDGSGNYLAETPANFLSWLGGFPNPTGTTGQYLRGDGSLATFPTLGTAASQNSTAFATAAQGATADSALQPAGNGASLSGLTKGQVGLSNVENTALSTWPGTTSITTLGTVSTGIWNGTAISDTYIASASTWNGKLSPSGNGSSLTGLTKTQVGLPNVENTALSTWAGSTNVVTLGSISTGTWTATPVSDSYIASSATWNAKISNITGLITAGSNISISGSGTSVSPYSITVTGLGTAAAQNTTAFATAAQGSTADSAVQPAALTSALSTKFNTPTGSTAQYVRGDGTLATLPSPGSGTVTNMATGTGLTGGPITTTGTISIANVGTAGTYSGVTTNAQGQVTAGTTRSFTTPSRSIVTSTSATGYQISSTRDAVVNYEGIFSTTSTIGGPSSISLFLETADTNSTNPGDWTIIARQRNSNTITLAIVLQQVDDEPWNLSRTIPAGKYVRIRSGSVTGTATASINAEQQEVLQ